MTPADLQTPCLLVHLDRVRHNLARMAQMLDGDVSRWRPHVKTSKIPEVLKLVLATGVTRFKCATSREAVVLLDQADRPLDLLVAMAHQGANLARLLTLAGARAEHRWSMLSEHPDHASSLRAAGLGVFVDLDPGYHRSGIPLSDRQRIEATIAAAGDGFRGLHYYDGHLHSGTPDERMAQCREIYGHLLDLANDHLQSRACEIITSGTPTFPMALAYAPFRPLDHTISPGTVVYWDTRSQRLGIDGFTYAVEVQARVISRPSPDRVTLDAGSKAVDAAAGDPCAAVLGPWSLRALTPSEEHLPLRVESGDGPELGAVLRLVPRHVCPTVNLADEAVLLEDDDVVAVVPVRARGHET